VDRLFVQGYVPRLQSEGLVVRFLLDRGFPIPSPALLGRIGRDYVKQINAFVLENEIPVVKFSKGDVKEEIAREHFQAAEREGRFGVVMVGIAQEKTSAWRGWSDGGPDGHPHFVYRRQSIFPNNYYFYIRDPDWGPSFIKTIAYAPFSIWIYLNGNEWAKRQAAQHGIACESLDNGFAACENSELLAEICQRLSASEVWVYVERWQARLPSPFTAEDRRRGYGYDLASASWRSPTPACLTAPPAVAHGLSRRCPTSSPSGARTRSLSCSPGASRARHPAGFTPGSSTPVSKRPFRCTTAPRRSSSTSKKAAR
jgi:hypothetical protein